MFFTKNNYLYNVEYVSDLTLKLNVIKIKYKMENKNAYAVIMSASQFDSLNERLSLLEQHLKEMSGFNFNLIIDNDEFIKQMGISKTTAQSWRDKGLISYSQIGHKIYYTLDDVEQAIKNHHVKAFQTIKNYKSNE